MLSAFRLPRLAQNVCPRSGLNLGRGIFPVNFRVKWRVRRTFGSWDVQKVYAVVAQSAFRNQNVQNATCRCQFWTLKRGFARDSAPCQKWAKREQFQKHLQAWDTSRGSGKMHFPWQAQYKRHVLIRDVRRSERWFPERGCILEHQIVRFAKIDDFAWQVQHFVWPGITFSWQAQ